jgi:hypothetical protein
MNALNLTFLSLYRINGQEWPLLPGLFAQNPPKKTARGRELDRLMVYLTLAGNLTYSTSEYAQITGQVAETFYATPGSLTFALKTAVEALNTFLVDRNMKTTGKGQYSIGALVLCALRANSIYIVQSGPTHVYHLAGESRHLNDPQLAGKGLGLSQTAKMYFAQATINSGDRLVLCAALPPNWDKSLSEEHGIPALEATRRRLLAITDTNVSAVLVQAVDGTGEINILSAVKSPAVEPAPAAAQPPTPKPVLPPAPVLVEPTYAPVTAAPVNPPVVPPSPEPEPVARPVVEAVPTETVRLPVSTPAADPEPLRVEPPAQVPAPVKPVPAKEEAYSPEPRVLIRPETREKLQNGLRVTARFLLRSIQGARTLSQKIVTWGGTALPRLLPGEEEGTKAVLPPSLPLFVSILIPLLVITLGIVAYRAYGQPEQFKSYYAQAVQARDQAKAETDPAKVRVQWETVIDRLNRADSYRDQIPPESKQLREEAQGSLDKLGRIVRLEYKPAFSTQLSQPLNVTHMAASDTDIYLLAADRGEVLRGTYNGHNYDLDTGFQCKPGTYDGIQVGPLIDLFALARSNATGATVIGIDASGSLLYCTPGEPPKASFLQIPDTGWKKITSVAYDANNLYVLDAPARAVWVYFGTFQIKFPDKPYFFFEAQIPVMLEQAIGLAINGDDLYLLHQDGHLTTCTLSRIDVSPTRCNDPALYMDTRPGYPSGIRLTDGEFSQIAFTSPPDPSVAMLEPYTQSVFRFSARALELQNQVRASAENNPLPKGAPVTAMAFSPNKVLFLFVGGQVFYAVNVP